MYVILYMHKGEVISSRIDYETFPSILDTLEVGTTNYSVVNLTKLPHDSDQVIIILCDVAVSN